MYKLVIEDDEGKTTTVPISRDEITIGRQKGNTIQLTERNVSRRHARLLRADGKVEIEDVASRYGTRFNGEKLKEKRAFKEGDVVVIGDYRLSLQAEVKAAAPPGVVNVPPSAPSSAEQTRQTQAIDAAAADVPAEEAGRLVVISSNYAGREYALTRAEMVIGRTEGDIRIDHRSISRNHAKIVRDGERYKIIDLRSSNGVRVNGEEYRSVHLKRGDVIELGHVRFRYVAPGEAFTFRPESVPPVDVGPVSGLGGAGGSGGLGKLLVMGVGASLLLLVLVVVALLAFSAGPGGGGADEGLSGPVAGKGGDDPTDEAPVVDENAEVAEFIKKADDAVADEEWDRAIVYLDEALEADPGSERAQDKKSEALREKGMQKFYEQGKTALEQKNFQTAMENFGKIPEDLSIYYKKIKDEGLLQKATEGFVNNRLDEADFAVKNREWRSAQNILAEVDKYDEDNERAEQLRAQINRELSRLADKGDKGSKGEGRQDKGDKPGIAVVKETPPAPSSSKPNGGGGGMSAAEKREAARAKLKEARQAAARGNPQQAVQLASEAKRLGAGVSADLVLGQAYQKMGNNSAAVRHYNAWLRANGSSKLADKMRAKIQTLGGVPVN